MDFASPYAFVAGEEDDNDESLDVAEEELEQGISSNLAMAGLPGDAAAAPAAPRQEAKESSGFFSRIFGSRKEQAADAAPNAAPPVGNAGAHAGSAGAAPRARVAQHNANAKRFHREADTNIVVLKFGTLADNADDIFAGDPIFCGQCQASFSITSKLTHKKAAAADDDSKGALPESSSSSAGAPSQQPMKIQVNDKPVDAPPVVIEDVNVAGPAVWKCEFCGHENQVNIQPEEMPKTNSRDYVLEPAVVDDSKADAHRNDAMVIFVVDISGSMCVTTEVPGTLKLKGSQKKRQADFDLPAEAGFVDAPQQRAPSRTTWVSRLQCVQAAVDHQIEHWSKKQPNKRVGLVTFNDEVTIVGDGSKAPEVIAGNKLHNEEVIKQISAKYALDKPLSETHKALSDKVFDLNEGGRTALGPALLAAVSMASTALGSHVIVCTDGLANVGVGALDKSSCKTDLERQQAEQWYEKIGQQAKLGGVTVSVISIKGDECSLEDLGRVAEITGGEVSRVDPLELTKNFSSILENPVVATQVSALILLHNGLSFRNEQEVGQNRIRREVGNVAADTEITFEYSVKSKRDAPELAQLKELPFQVQITFTRLDGMKCLRVLSRSQPITRDKVQAEKQLRMDVVASNAAQQSAKLAALGDYLGARVTNRAYARVMERNQRSNEDRSMFAGWVNSMDHFDNALQQQQSRMDMSSASAAPRAGPQADAPALGAGAPPAAPASASGRVMMSSVAAPASESQVRSSKAVRSDADYEMIAQFKKKGWKGK